MPAWRAGSWAADAWAGTAWDESVAPIGRAWFATAWASGSWGASSWALAEGGAAVPTIISLTATATTATVSWVGAATQYRIDEGSATALPDGTSPDTITGLTANTEYSAPGLQLRDGPSGVWSTAFAFGTENDGSGGGEIELNVGVAVAASGAVGGVVSAGVDVTGITGIVSVSVDAAGAVGGVVSVSVLAAATGAAPSVILDPVSVAVPEGSTVSFTAGAIGDDPITVQWERDAFAAGSWTTIPGATSTTLTGTASYTGGFFSNSDQFRARFSNASGIAYTEPATLTTTLAATVAPDASALAARELSRRRTLRATSERHVNYMLKRSEAGPEKSLLFREQVPGLARLGSVGAEARGAFWTGSRLFIVAGSALLEVFSDWTTAVLGSLLTSTGRVEMAQGLFSLVVVDGPNGYVLTLANSTFSRITDPDFLGSRRVAFLDGRFIFAKPNSQQWFWSAGIDTAADYSALDFASAERRPDNIVGHLVDHGEIWLFGQGSVEVWFPAPTVDSPYARNNGANIESGLAAAFSAQRIDNTIYYVGQDERGQGVVWAIGGPSSYQPVRISTHDLEEELAKLDDLSGAWAWTYQDAGQTFYVLNVPGLSSTWVYDASVQKWHERAEFFSGDIEPWRCTTHAFAFGRHVVADADGGLYELDAYEYTNDGDVLYRLWTTPHNAAPSRQRVTFQRLRLDVTTGETASGLDPQIEMAYSNNGGFTWGAWSKRSSGKLGEWAKPVKWDRLGQGRDRVWRFRCTDDAKVSIVGLHVDAVENKT
jgi:hypothetical protein